jgi:hypothetical protein
LLARRHGKGGSVTTTAEVDERLRQSAAFLLDRLRAPVARAHWQFARSVLDFGALWRLARHWYDGRLEPGFVRREPSQARANFRDVGLRGSF